MSGRRFDREPVRGNHREYARYASDRPAHDGFPRRPLPPRDHSRRSPSPRPPNISPSYGNDHQPKSDGNELKIKGASAARDKDASVMKREARDDYPPRSGRSPSPTPQFGRPYRDRDGEGYRSRSPSERAGNSSRQWRTDRESEERGYRRPAERSWEKPPVRGHEIRQERSWQKPRERSWERARELDYDEDQKGPNAGRGWTRFEEESDERRSESQQERSRRPREDSRQRYRSRSRDRRRDESPYYGGPPSRDVMLEGLPSSWVEDDITTELMQYYGVGKIDTVRVIRDKLTKQSRRFGFVTFPSIEAAKSFLASSYPSLSIQSPLRLDSDAESPRIRVAFSIARDDREPQQNAKSGDWICQSCSFLNFKGRTSCRQCHAQFDASALASDLGAATSHMNIGESDVSPDGTPSQFLVVRNLELSVTEDLFARGVSKLLKPNNPEPTSGPSSSKKGRNKMRSTTGDANLGAREGTLRRILLVRDRTTNDSWRYGFAEFSTIEDAQAALIRYNSFERFTIASKPVTVDYIHAGVFVPVLDGHDAFQFSPLGNPSTKLTYWDENAYCNEVAVAEDSTDETKDQDMATAAGDASAHTAIDKDGRARKRKGDVAESAAKQKKSTPAHLQYWSDRHAELHGKRLNANNDRSMESEAQETDTPMKEIPKKGFPIFVDLGSACCWLCMRQLEDSIEAARHERADQMHHDNLKDEKSFAKAKEMVTKRTLPRREITRTWIDLAGQFCYLCYLDFGSAKETSRHEHLSKTHRANLSDKEAVQRGLNVLRSERIVPRTVVDAYVDIVGRCCYLCNTEFEDELHTRRHRWACSQHRAKLRDENATRQADAFVEGICLIERDPLPETFIDKRSRSCLLCWKQFATDQRLYQHESNGMHRRNLANEDAVYTANIRLGRATGLETDPDDNTTSLEYRDRAAERRKAFGTSEKISLAFKKKGGKAEVQPPSKDTPSAPTPSKGAALLGKMGWQAGQGLGAQSTGMTAAIATDMYAQGVGLGAEGGKIGNAVEEAGRNTGGDYKEFVSRTRDKAKERYRNME